MEKKLKNRIAIVLDRSSSMGAIAKEAAQMFNDQVKEIKANFEGMDTTVSLFTFSTIVDKPTIFNRPSHELKPLEAGEYIPAGWTALYDAMGEAIEQLSLLPEMSDPDCSFLVITITDGEENQSKKFTGQRLADQIMLLQKTGRWTFTFCGANIDVEKISKELHIPKSNTTSWSADMAGTHMLSASNAGGIRAYSSARSAGGTSVDSFYDPKGQAIAPATTTTTTTTTKVKTP